MRVPAERDDAHAIHVREFGAGTVDVAVANDAHGLAAELLHVVFLPITGAFLAHQARQVFGEVEHAIMVYSARVELN